MAAPHPITITVDDVDNSTPKSGAKVFVRNATKKTISDEATTNGSGQAIIDLANLPIAAGKTEPYEAGDVIFIVAYANSALGEAHDASRYVVTGSSYSKTLYLNPLPFLGGPENQRITTVRLMQILTANTGASVAYCKVYSLQDGQLLAHVETPANSSLNIQFGSHGKSASEGFVVEREANTLVVTATVK